jgi:glycosyltransferase involved in cell wall biosynthesis
VRGDDHGAPAFDVCAAVVSDLPYDARAWKEARSLAAAGHRVALLGCRYGIDRTRWRMEGDIAVFEIAFGSRAKISQVRRAIVLLRLWAEILRVSARAYHAHNIHVGPPAWLAARLRRSALVYDAHELWGGDGGGHKLLERILVRGADAVITTNRSRAETLRYVHRRRHIDVIANVPPRVERVEPIDPGYPDGAPVLLYQGHVDAESRPFRETLEALRELDGVHFVILGFARESRLELVRRWAEELGVADRVHLLPPRPFDELVRTAAAATVGIVPIKALDLNFYLGDTNKLHEYLMAGLPVVASDLPEIRRVAREGSPPVGELFDPESPQSIAGAVRRVLADPDERAARGREARRLAMSRFNWENEEHVLLDVYERVLPAAAP